VKLQYQKGVGIKEVKIAAQMIRRNFNITCTIESAVGIVLGSGLGYFIDSLKNILSIKEIPYREIPNFPSTSVEGHNGILVCAEINNVFVFILQGRTHLYEGYNAQEIVFPIRTLSFLGVKSFILSHAAGGINKKLHVGDLMLIRDHINFTADNPLLGTTGKEFGKRFLDLNELYDPQYIEIAKYLGKKINLVLHEGVYACLQGPSYETVSEIKFLAMIGCDSVGMSIVHESIAAYQLGARVLAVSCITNKAAGCSTFIINHNEVKNISFKVGNYFSRLLLALLSALFNNSNNPNSYFVQ